MSETTAVPTDHAAAYRWVVLAAFMAVNLTIQVLWISYAPITNAASDYYGVSDVAIGALAMSFMVAYLPLSLPASAAIAHRGFLAGVARGLVGPHYVPVLVATVGALVVHRLPEPKRHLAMRDALANAGDRERDGVL